ncbi:hypothetical protein MMC30_000303 [Trapelia coarctata]|nr:hypothetical protein [Trapelia coarctata]
MNYYRRLLCGTLFLTSLSQPTLAQNIVISATAAWSSQIVAFWGAILIGVRASARGIVTNAFTSLFCAARTTLRARHIEAALTRGNWLLHSGWENGKKRIDVVVIYWTSPADLKRLARSTSMYIEVFADQWEVLVVGRRTRSSTISVAGTARWIQSPRHESLCGARSQTTGASVFPLSVDTINEGIGLLKANPVSDVIRFLYHHCSMEATRVVFKSELPTDDGSHPSLAYFFTSIEVNETPYVSLERKVGQSGVGVDRVAKPKSAIAMFILVHITVSAAVGLMGAASGRGLAVWLMGIRPALLSLGSQNVGGTDALTALLAMDKSSFTYQSRAGSMNLAGHVTSNGNSSRSLALAFLLPLLETALITAGWLYGALQAQKLAPTGVVGHGMLWLSALVGLSLSVRALLGTKARLSGRLLGYRQIANHRMLTIAARNLEISVDRILQSATPSNSIIALAISILREDHDETMVALTAESILARPEFNATLDAYIAHDILQYRYQGDEIISRGDPPKPVSPRDIYPWMQTCSCILFTILCGVVSVVYAYVNLPMWVKLVTEGLLATSAMWFSTLERTAGLPHNRDTYVCFMVATLVISSVWYVGVQGLG